MEESNLYRVSDPASGSGAFEALTNELAEEAWKLFQKIETTGGVDQALTGGLIHGWIAQANEARRNAIKSGAKPILGISLHPHDGADDAGVLDVAKRPALVITKGALTIDPLSTVRDEELLGDAS